MDMLSHHDSSVIGSFAINKIAYYVNIELPQLENSFFVLSTDLTQQHWFSIAGNLVSPIAVDTDLLLFFIEIARNRKLSFALPVKIEKATLMVINFNIESIPSYYYLRVSSKGQSETIQFYPKRMTLQRNYFPVQE